MPYAALPIRHILNPRSATSLILIGCIAALGFVFSMQYGFGLQPCMLCLWQRWPFAAAALTALIILLWKPDTKHTNILLALCAVIFLTGVGLAIFHSGVERHWWAGTASCTSQPLTSGTAEELRHQLLQTPVARCDQISWTLLGLSMANWNILLSLGLSLFSLRAALKSLSTAKART